MSGYYKYTPAEVVLSALRSVGMVVPPNVIAFEITADGTEPGLLRVRFDCVFSTSENPVLPNTHRAHYEIRLTHVDQEEQ